MVKLKRSQIRIIERAVSYPKGHGYVLDFSDRTIVDFFEDEFGIDFAEEKYFKNGTSKRNRLITLIEIEHAHTVAKILRALWDRRDSLINRFGNESDEISELEIRKTFLNIIIDVEGGSEIPRMDALERYVPDQTLDELIRDIERDLQANKPEAAMDHLHTYCMKKFSHLLRIREIPCSDDEALHSRFAKYKKALLEEQDLSSFTDRALKSAISMLESFNDIRNHRSFAHDNPILDPIEARYVFDTMSAILLFLRAIESGRYDSN